METTTKPRIQLKEERRRSVVIRAPTTAQSRVGLFTLFFLLTGAAPLQGVDGCPYSKLDSGHTMCVFKPRLCSGKRLIKSGGISCSEREMILDTHNQLRQSIALGRIRDQPAALNMETMVWNEELAEIAQRWADQCMTGHDRSRDTGRFTVGQNVAAVWTYEHDEGPKPDFKTQIKAWFNEVMKQGFSKSTIEPFRYSKIVGHYTQLAWADTFMVGCGFSYFYDKTTGFTKLYVCNYAPGGNVMGGSMYKVGFAGEPHCIPYGLEPNSNMHGLCVRDGVNYMKECNGQEGYSSSSPVETHSTPHSSTHVMIPPGHRPPLKMLRNQMTPPPPSSSSKKNQATKSHHNRYHSSTVSHSHSHFNLPNSFHHAPSHQSPFLNGILSPFKTFGNNFNSWKNFNKFRS